MSENYGKRMAIWKDLERMKEYEKVTTIAAQNGSITYYYEHGGTKIIDSLGGVRTTDPIALEYIRLKQIYANANPLLQKLRNFFNKKEGA